MDVIASTANANFDVFVVVDNGFFIEVVAVAVFSLLFAIIAFAVARAVIAVAVAVAGVLVNVVDSMKNNWTGDAYMPLMHIINFHSLSVRSFFLPSVAKHY